MFDVKLFDDVPYYTGNCYTKLYWRISFICNEKDLRVILFYNSTKTCYVSCVSQKLLIMKHLYL